MSNDGGSEVSLIAEELGRAVELTMNPTVSQEARLHAYNACESFKENSPWCAQAGLLLASNEGLSAVVRHFGLQLMEHTVKYRWTQISQPEKLFIKENAMKLLYSGGWETAHLNDGLARVIVEMAKREWPQHWPQLLAELSDACARGHRHTEIVLHVFLRLVEDVATLQTLEANQRRKDIYQALTSNMAEIFGFFLRLIEMHVQEFREKTAAGDFIQAASNGRVVQVVLLTLTGFVEWVSMNHIVGQNGRLLQILCILLGDESFQLSAAECLLQIVNRKGPLKERKPLMILLSEDAISCVHRAAVASTHTLDEKHYLFLKKLAQVLSGLGQQLSSMWSRSEDGASGPPQPPPQLSVFLETLLVFSAHPSLTLAQQANSVWLALMKHDLISKEPVLLAFLPRWVQHTAPKILKVSYPVSRPTGVTPDAVTYAAIDYDSENEFAMFFCRCRTDFLDTFRQATLLAPLVTFEYVEHWLRVLLQDLAQQPTDTQGNVQHPVYLKWEALSQLLESVLSRILMITESRPSVSSGLALMELCLEAEPQDPLLLSLLLSFISALFVFLSMSSCQIAQAPVSLLPRVLDKIFGALVSEEGTVRHRRPRAVRNLRRHAASLMVKLGHKYPLLLLPVFPRIRAAVHQLLARPHQLSAMESVTLQEALLLISNHFCDYNRQRALVGEVLGDCQGQWSAMAPHFSSPEGLIRLLGLDTPPLSPSQEDVHGQNRSHLLHTLNLLLGVVKRCAWPDDPDKASRGGFSGGMTAGGNPIWRNPCAAHVLPVLPHLLALCRALNGLYQPAALALLSEGYKNVYSMLEVERQNLLGVVCQADPLDPSAKREATPLDRMQQFITTLQDNVCHLLGSAGPSLGRELYATPGLGTALVQSVLSGLDHVPDYRLRPIVRVFLRPFIYSCPPAHYHQVLLPIIAHVAPIMLNRLSSRWDYITSLYEAGKFEEENANDTQEVLEDMLNRNLTREYLDVLKVALVGGSLQCEGATMDADEGSMDGAPGAPSPLRAPDHISELGGVLLSCPHTSTPIIHTIISALAWQDSTSSLRACGLAGPALRYAACETASPLPATLACRALAAVLHALHAHGQHDANQAALLALGIHLYEALRPRYPAMVQIMQQIPNVNMADIHKLDEKISTVPTKGNKIEKSKKELFKRITSQLIGRSIGQLFRKEVLIADLPTMTAPKEKVPSVMDKPESTGLSSLFAQNTPS